MADQEELKEYTLTVNGIETTMQLNEADAKRLGALGDSDGTDGANQVQTTPGTKAATAPNKARGAANK